MQLNNCWCFEIYMDNSKGNKELIFVVFKGKVTTVF